MGKELLKINTERQRQRYSKEFKLKAVQLLQARKRTKGARHVFFRLAFEHEYIEPGPFNSPRVPIKHDGAGLANSIRDLAITLRPS